MRIEKKTDHPLNRNSRLIAIVSILCLCVFAQMLGMPGSLIDLLPLSGTAVTSVSEDVSLSPLALEPNIAGLSLPRVLVRSTLHLPVLVTSVVHPPQV